MVAYVPPKQAGKYKAVASGAITNGKPVIVNADGTVGSITSSNAVTVFDSGSIKNTAIATNGSGTVLIVYRDEDDSGKGKAIAGTISNGEITYGSEAIFEAGAVVGGHIYTTAVVYDASNSKFVILYCDDDNSDYPTAIVATVSGTSISFGTAVVIGSNACVDIEGTYDSTAEKIVVAYYGGSTPYLTGIVGTVSGTDISFGSASTLASKSPFGIEVAYDSNANKSVVVYRDNGGTNNGFALVATVSGTSISASGDTNFTSSTAQQFGIAFDSSANKLVIVFMDQGDSLKHKAVVATVSGTSISFGSISEVNIASYSTDNKVVYDSVNNKHIITCDVADANLTRVIATVSGTSLSYDTAVTLLSGNKQHIKTAYDSGNDTAVIALRDTTNSGRGTSILAGSGTYSATSTNLTSENYIGIASGGTYADTAEATIDVVGTVNKDQSGLTAGQTYYVQTDGTLGTSADSPSVVAGTAISATEIIVKG